MLLDVVNLITFTHLSVAVGQKIYLENYNTIIELLRQFIVSEVFLVFELNRPRFESRRRQWHPTPVLLPEKSHGWRTWWAAVHGVTKSRTQLSDFTFTFHFHALEKEMATHFSVLAWRIPGTGEPRGLPSMGSHRVRRLKGGSSSRFESRSLGVKT